MIYRHKHIKDKVVLYSGNVVRFFYMFLFSSSSVELLFLLFLSFLFLISFQKFESHPFCILHSPLELFCKLRSLGSRKYLSFVCWAIHAFFDDWVQLFFFTLWFLTTSKLTDSAFKVIQVEKKEYNSGNILKISKDDLNFLLV